jgi:hypothetical protein
MDGMGKQRRPRRAFTPDFQGADRRLVPAGGPLDRAEGDSISCARPSNMRTVCIFCSSIATSSNTFW